MEIPPISSQGWADRITWLVYGVVGTGGAAALLNSIFNRKKQPSEIAKIDAETDQTGADTSVKLSTQLIILHDKLNGLESTLDRERQESIDVRREAAEARMFHREQLRYWEALDNAYRNRFHAIQGELQRLSNALLKLQLLYKQDANREPPEIETRSFDSIVEAYPLPTPPEK